MSVKVAFLPLGVRGDLTKYPQLRPAIVERLKSIAPAAEKAGVVIGLETALDAANEVKLLDEIGSPAIRIYFNFENALQARRDLLRGIAHAREGSHLSDSLHRPGRRVASE